VTLSQGSRQQEEGITVFLRKPHLQDEAETKEKKYHLCSETMHTIAFFIHEAVLMG
jgi:hypothetical protein